jgi:hypothetical protein
MSKEAMKLALEDYLSREMPAGTVIGDPKWWAGKIANLLASQENLIPSNSTELEKQEQGEPVAGVVMREGNPTLLRDRDIKLTDERLYTTPQQRKPLTDKQLNIIGSRWHLNLLGTDEKAELFAFARAIEAAHGIKGSA